MGLILSEPGRPCLCGALDCRSCGPAQGYSVERDDDDDDDTDADDWLDRRCDDELTQRDEVEA